MGKEFDCLDFHLKRGNSYTVSGRRFRLNEFGIQTLEHLFEIYESCRTRSDPSWAIKARPLIREIQNGHQVSILTLVVERTPDQLLRILAIWLRGRCRGTLGTKVLAKFSNDPDFLTRKEAARALKRMSAWSVLATVADSDSSEKIRRIATSRPGRPISERIADFTYQLSRMTLPTNRRQVFLSRDLDLSQSRPPKSFLTIRAILERIHLAVTGHRS